ncbi:DUF3604 domain-containing protein [Geotalea sp. SG265]|uniref:DUF3604 domain-containing protein n=1 Tax=Geotalea sp. SG265 TaxID=2922867 RepID=UPI00325FD34D
MGKDSTRNNARHSTYLADRLGAATISPMGDFVAGSFASWTLTYTAGYYGIDDTGSLKIVYRFASDMGTPQFHDPVADNYVTAEADNGVVLELRYDRKGNLRPWDKTIHVRVQRGTLRAGDRITIYLGDTRFGSAGMFVQTFCEPSFEFRVLVDAFATYNFVELPHQPAISIVAGEPVAYQAVLPTLRRVNEPFSLGFKGEDKWGNPSNGVHGSFRLESSVPVKGLPEVVTVAAGTYAISIKGLEVGEPCDLKITVRDDAGAVLCVSNSLRIVEQAELLPFWADLHGQSEETIGTNSARQLIEFARDRAFLDAMSHQGNDFQITNDFWQELNRLTAEYNRDGEFITFPGYEWSGNTGLGGDRNILFRHENRQIHRSHHACLEDLSDVGSDAATAADLFRELQHEDCIVFAHVGGRYADLGTAHNAQLERSVEVHSDWGTFEWLLEDAFSLGHRVGIVANSDGHKGRHGASHPGASLFGAYGGLTCLLAKELTRDALFEALRQRHHYATTGCRAFLQARIRFNGPAGLYGEDPVAGGSIIAPVLQAQMGDIVSTTAPEVTLEIDFVGSAPVERVEIRNGTELLETWRPYRTHQLGRRIRVIWEGAEYRGRGRETHWDGHAELSGNSFEQVKPINRWNLTKAFTHSKPGRVNWQAVTTGGFGGFEALLTDQESGALSVETAPVKAEIAVPHIGLEDTVLPAQGEINRQIRVFRLPDENRQQSVALSRNIALRNGDNPLYVCITQEDGHRIWSSPTYVLHEQQ